MLVYAGVSRGAKLQNKTRGEGGQAHFYSFSSLDHTLMGHSHQFLFIGIGISIIVVIGTFFLCEGDGGGSGAVSQ